ncbi:MAG: energy transducer TonB, partial [Opitutae bacterium]|nr:energy transducer TonB [Opitutae bacterium]
ALRAAGVEGTVVVEFTVDTQGTVVSATVRSATNREFEEATIRAVMRWRFEAGRREGRAVPFRMAVPLVFRLDDRS